MFDDAYFKEHLVKQVEELGECSVTIHLTDGSQFRVSYFEPDGAMKGYVLLEVYPQEGVTKESKAKRRKPGVPEKVFFDKVAVPYEYITRVFLTVVDPQSKEESQPFGFPTPTKKHT